MLRTALVLSLLLAGCPKDDPPSQHPRADGGSVINGTIPDAAGGGAPGGGVAGAGRYCIWDSISFTTCVGSGSFRDTDTLCARMGDGESCPPPPAGGGAAGDCYFSHATVPLVEREAESCAALFATLEEERCAREGEGFCDGERECSDGLDNNHNGLADCDEWWCVMWDVYRPSGERICVVPEASIGRCIDGRDDDDDGEWDYFDDGCADLVAANEGLDPRMCSDLVDNDGDGLVDCEETLCSDERHDPYYRYCALPYEICNNGVDDDLDGWKDCEESGCRCNEVEGNRGNECADGEDNDGNGLVDCEESSCITGPAPGCAHPEVCDDGFDNDRDELYDLEDEDCW